MRSCQILSFLLKDYDINFHITEDKKYSMVMFDNKNGKKLCTLTDNTLTKLHKQGMRFSARYKNPKIYPELHQL